MRRVGELLEKIEGGIICAWGSGGPGWDRKGSYSKTNSFLFNLSMAKSSNCCQQSYRIPSCIMQQSPIRSETKCAGTFSSLSENDTPRRARYIAIGLLNCNNVRTFSACIHMTLHVRCIRILL